MIVKVLRWLRGWRDYRVAENIDAAADLLALSGTNFRRMRRSDDTLTFSLEWSQCAIIESAMEANSITYEITGEHGIPRLLRKYKKRIGIPIGVLLFVLIILASEQFIWSFEIIGNENISDRDILARLDALGCGVGTYIHSIDFDKLHSEFLLEDDSFAWVSVNVRGTHATVEVRELVPHVFDIDESLPHNLVASEDGVVEYIEILRGQKIAREEELVREGELLASGIEQMKHGLRLTHARGTVLARVKREILIEVPLESTVREATGREFSEKYFNFFGFSIKIFSNTSNLPENCDRIVREDQLCFFDTVTVPITLSQNIYREWADVPITLTEDEARGEAYRQLREKCAEIAAESELISREINAGLRDGVYVIKCELTVLRDIAIEVPIYTTENQGGE